MSGFWYTSNFLSWHRCSLGLFLSTLFYVASICGVVYMYRSYASRSSCSLNIFFVTWTAILLAVMMAVSLHPKVHYVFINEVSAAWEKLLSFHVFCFHFLCLVFLSNEIKREKRKTYEIHVSQLHSQSWIIWILCDKYK